MVKEITKKQDAAKKMNQIFKGLSEEEQRIFIIQDAITQLKLGKIKAKTGTYLEVDSYESNDLRTNILNSSTCECCAKGALFTVCVMQVNKVKRGEYFNDNEFVIRKLKKWFTEEELDMMEIAFEMHDSLGGNSLSDKSSAEYLVTKCVKFGKKYNDPTKRMIAILKNTLKYGKFDPYCGKKGRAYQKEGL